MAKLGLPTEHEEQSFFSQWLTLRGIPHFAVDNEWHRGNAFAMQKWREKQGFAPGAPDLVIIPLAPKNCRPVAVEMKRQKGSQHRPTQKRMMRILEHYGWTYVLAKGCDAAIEAMIDLGFVTNKPATFTENANEPKTSQRKDPKVSKGGRSRRYFSA